MGRENTLQSQNAASGWRVDRPDQENAGMYFLNASTKQKPGVVDAQLNPILDQQKFTPVVTAGPASTSSPTTGPGTKVGCGLNHIQKLEMEIILAPDQPEDDFEPYEPEDEEENFLG